MEGSPLDRPRNAELRTLLHALEDHGPAIVQRVLDELYRDPLWDERYGERGRLAAEVELRRHLTYLAEALRAGEPTLLTHHARGLQSVLVNRGICSRHLSQSFAGLGEAITALIPHSALAGAYLRAAEQGVRYSRPPAAQLQAQAGSLAAQTMLALAPLSLHPGWQPSAREQVACLWSYLTDAVAAGRPAIFVDHVHFLAGSLAGRGVPANELSEVLTAMTFALSAAAPGTEAAAMAVLQAARESLHEPTEQCFGEPGAPAGM